MSLNSEFTQRVQMLLAEVPTIPPGESRNFDITITDKHENISYIVLRNLGEQSLLGEGITRDNVDEQNMYTFSITGLVLTVARFAQASTDEIK